MTPDHTSYELVELLHPAQTSTDADDPLTDAWCRAEAEAQAAYAAWRESPNADAYVVYLAADDRAAAAHDELASWITARNAWMERGPAPVAA